MRPPRFASLQEHRARRADVRLWGPYVAEVLERHGLSGAGRELTAGTEGTYPTFLCGEVVVKLFGGSPAWRQGFAGERAAQARVAADPEILAPRLLAAGRLFDDPLTPWPYLVTNRVAGVSCREAELSREQQRSLALEVGRQVRRIHALPPAETLTDEDWPAPDVAAAAAQSSLPPRLVAQVDEFVAGLEPFDPVFVHGDLTATHLFVEDGRLTGIIDWGDAMLTDRHYELIQVYRDLFACDSTLLRLFLEASEWPVGGSFARQALGHALRRQAVGLTQHHTMDVFEPVAARFPLGNIGTLEELAVALFSR